MKSSLYIAIDSDAKGDRVCTRHGQTQRQQPRSRSDQEPAPSLPSSVHSTLLLTDPFQATKKEMSQPKSPPPPTKRKRIADVPSMIGRALPPPPRFRLLTFDFATFLRRFDSLTSLIRFDDGDGFGFGFFQLLAAGDVVVIGHILVCLLGYLLPGVYSFWGGGEECGPCVGLFHGLRWHSSSFSVIIRWSCLFNCSCGCGCGYVYVGGTSLLFLFRFLFRFRLQLSVSRIHIRVYAYSVGLMFV
jgi:hypothetical protein